MSPSYLGVACPSTTHFLVGGIWSKASGIPDFRNRSRFQLGIATFASCMSQMNLNVAHHKIPAGRRENSRQTPRALFAAPETAVRKYHLHLLSSPDSDADAAHDAWFTSFRAHRTKAAFCRNTAITTYLLVIWWVGTFHLARQHVVLRADCHLGRAPRQRGSARNHRVRSAHSSQDQRGFIR